MNRHSQAFSLVELSIVLVILGLLTGGVLAGQSLIRAAELRSVTTQFQNYYTAVATFKDKNFAIPGDMSNATDFWLEAHATPATCKTTDSGGAATCNGDGDGQVDSPTGSDETFRFWQHLANAGLIEGSFTGVAESGGANHTTGGVNAPAGKLGSTAWRATHRTPVAGQFNRDYGNTLYVGKHVSNTAPYGVVLTPEEMWGIDTKVDEACLLEGVLAHYLRARNAQMRQMKMISMRPIT